MEGHRPVVVVVGAGFAGLPAVRRLASGPVDVVLVDRHNYNTFHPLLYQVATAGIDEGGVAHTIRASFARYANVDVRLASLVGLDRDRRVVALDDGQSVAYDALVLAVGATTNDFGVPGVAEHAFPLYTLPEAIRLREHVLRCFEATEREPSLVDDGALTCVMVGGGPTGVETAGTMVELFSKVLSKGYHRADVSRARVVLVEMGPELLAAFRSASRRHAREILEARGVDVRFGERVARVTAGGLVLASGEELGARTVVWTAGVKPNAIADRLGLDRGQGGRIVVGPDLSVPGSPEIFVVGDLAAPPSSNGRLLPQLAPVAMQEGRHAGEQVLRRLAGQATRPFRYRDKGTMATIGRRAAVADLPLGISLRGTLAWLAWLFLHLIYIMGFENRAQVLVQWAWNYVTWDWGPRLVLDSDD
ncbi:MAG TPA: NAD(P)/FAD-dependent oxidoreductase [Acidimicrobiia bacterium]